MSFAIVTVLVLHTAMSAGAVKFGPDWSLPLTNCVFVSVLQPSVIVKVRVIFQLQSVVWVSASVCDTVMVRSQLDVYIAFTWASVFSLAASSVE